MQPVRQCVGCRQRYPQQELRRFVRRGIVWTVDPHRKPRQPGRGAYLCSSQCAAKTAKNKRYPGLSAAAAEYDDLVNGSTMKSSVTIDTVDHHAR